MNAYTYIETIEKKFQEIFATETSTKKIGSDIHTFTMFPWKGICALYTMDVNSDTPYRYTTLIVDFCEDGTVCIGESGSMTDECRKLTDWVENYLTQFGYDYKVFVTTGK